MPQQKPSSKTTPDPEWRTRRPMTVSEAKQIIARNLKEAKAGVEIPDLTIKPLPEPTMEEAKAALKKAVDTRGARFRETFKPTYEKVKSISAANPGNKGLQDLQSTWDSFMDMKMAGEKNTPTTRAMAGMLRQARARGKGALGTALAAMGGAGMADEAWAAGMDRSSVKRTGGGRGTYQPPIRRSAFNVREQ